MSQSNSKAKSVAAMKNRARPQQQKSTKTTTASAAVKSKNKRTKKTLVSSDEEEESPEGRESDCCSGDDSDNVDCWDENKQRINRQQVVGTKQRVHKATTGASIRRVRKVLVDIQDEDD